MASTPSSARESSTLDNTASVWRRSTTPATSCRGLRMASREITKCMFIYSICYSTEVIAVVTQGRSGRQGTQQVIIVFREILRGLAEVLHLLAGMQHRGMVAATEGIPNLRRAVIGQFLGRHHGHPRRPGDRAVAALGNHIARLGLVVVRHGALDIVDCHHLVMQGKEILESLLHQLQIDAPPDEACMDD